MESLSYLTLGKRAIFPPSRAQPGPTKTCERKESPTAAMATFEMANDLLIALRSLLLNCGRDLYWQERGVPPLVA
jgi:hypothetical protein